MKTMRVVSLAALALLIPAVALAEPAHSLEIVESTKTLLSDVAYYLKYVLPGAAIVYSLYGGLQRVMSGDDEMKRAKADKTMTNAKLGLVLGLAAAPILAWLQQYYAS